MDMGFLLFSGYFEYCCYKCSHTSFVKTYIPVFLDAHTGVETQVNGNSMLAFVSLYQPTLSADTLCSISPAMNEASDSSNFFITIILMAKELYFVVILM